MIMIVSLFRTRFNQGLSASLQRLHPVQGQRVSRCDLTGAGEQGAEGQGQAVGEGYR
jgi:hypothetical protein